jgi:hypothetical protein
LKILKIIYYPEKYKQYINLHIFPSTLKDHSLSQKMNDDINIDSIITLSRKQVFNGLLVKKGTNEKGQKDKQRSKKHKYKTKDRVTRTPLKTGGELRC